AHRPPICEADLDVENIFAEKTAIPLMVENANPDLPAIFGVRPFPFLLPLAGKIDSWTEGEDNRIYAVLSDRRLVQFVNHERGGRVLASDIPGGKAVWMNVDEDRVYIVKTGTTHRPVRLLSFSLSGGTL